MLTLEIMEHCTNDFLSTLKLYNVDEEDRDVPTHEYVMPNPSILLIWATNFSHTKDVSGDK